MGGKMHGLTAKLTLIGGVALGIVGCAPPGPVAAPPPGGIEAEHPSHEHPLGVEPELAAPPTSSPASAQAAVDHAQSTMTVWVDRGIDQETWWAALSPLLTINAQHDYQYVRTHAVPATRLLSAGVFEDLGTPYLASVTFETDAGRYRLLLQRLGESEPWLVERLEPVEAVIP